MGDLAILTDKMVLYHKGMERQIGGLVKLGPPVDTPFGNFRVTAEGLPMLFQEINILHRRDNSDR